MDKYPVEAVQFFLIQKENGRKILSRSGPLGSERLLFAVSVVKRSDGSGTVSFPHSTQKPFSMNLDSMTAEEFARKLLSAEETKYGTPRTT